MALSRINSIVFHADDLNGHPLSGGKVYTYIAGGGRPVPTYNALGLPNENPVRLDIRGNADIWLDPAMKYKFVVKSLLGTTVLEADNITSNSRTFEAEGDGIIVTESKDEDGKTVVSFSIAKNSIGREQLKNPRDLIVDSQYLSMDRQEGSSEVILSLAAEVPSNDGTYVLKMVNGTMQWVAE